MSAKKNSSKKVAKVEAVAAVEPQESSAAIEAKVAKVIANMEKRVGICNKSIDRATILIGKQEERITKAQALCETRIANIRLKGDPKTKKQAMISKLQAKMAKLQADLDAMD